MSTQLHVTNLERAIQFYMEVLGFEEAFRYEDFYAGIVKDDCSIHLKQSVSGSMKEGDDLDILFSVDHIDLLYKMLSDIPVRITQPLREMPYGKEFYIADPDGNRIGFMESFPNHKDGPDESGE